MIAEIISIGDELTSGKILDTNAQWLAQELSDLGIRVLFHTTVGDDLQANIDVFRIAASRAGVVIATGGLGPTADDLTRDAIAALLDVPLEYNDDAMESIRALFAKRGRTMPSTNEKQAFIPKGGNVIRNPNGTAPGIDALAGSSRIIALPGVPAEMKEMWHQTVRDLLETHFQKISGKKRVIRFRSIHSFGAGESQVEAMLPDLVNRSRVPAVGITANMATITLRIQNEADTEKECFEQMEPTAKIIYEKLGTLIFGEDQQTLADVVCEKLNAQKKTISVMEWGTSGYLDELLAVSPLSEKCFLGGLVVRSASALRSTIRYSSELSHSQEIPEGTADETLQNMLQSNPQHGEKIVALMCRHALKMFESDFSLAIGPYPNDALQERANRLREPFPVYVGLGQTSADGTATVITESHPYGGHPALIDDLYTKRALNLFRLRVD